MCSRDILTQIQESEAKPSSLALEALSAAQELCAKAAGTRGTRQAYFIGRLMAKEHLVSGDPSTAHRLLLLVAGKQFGLCLSRFK